MEESLKMLRLLPLLLLLLLLFLGLFIDGGHAQGAGLMLAVKTPWVVPKFVQAYQLQLAGQNPTNYSMSTQCILEMNTYAVGLRNLTDWAGWSKCCLFKKDFSYLTSSVGRLYFIILCDRFFFSV